MAEQDAGDTGPVTYAELGARLGLSADGARTRAKRQGWRIIRGNDGRARVIAPLAELPAPPPVMTRSDPVKTELARSHAEHLADLAARLTGAEQAAEQWRLKAEQTGREAERDRAQLELVRDQAAKAERRVDSLEAELRDLRRPWIVRVVAALRR